MEKTATLNLRINPTLKADVDAILSRLGIPMSTAVDMFFNQIVLVGGIPFSVTIPKPPADSFVCGTAGILPEHPWCR